MQYAGTVRDTFALRNKMLNLAADNEDVRGFSAVDSNVLKAIELEGRFAGALSEVHVSNTTNIAVIEVLDQPEDLGECIEIDADPLL